MQDPSLSIVIVSWTTRDLLHRCLAAIAAGQGARPGPAVEVIVVDNASSDGSAELVRSAFPWVSLLENSANLGFARANNQGIAQAHGRYVVLLNSDTEVQDDALARLASFADAHPQAGAVGPRLLNADGSLQPSCHPMLTPTREFWRLLFMEPIRPRATYPLERWGTAWPRRVEVIKGACVLLRAAALAQVGPLDERYFIYTEEVDLCYRLAQAGWELWWEPAARVVHYGGASTRQAAQEMYVQLYRSKIQFYRKFGGARQALRFKRLLRVAYWPRLVVAACAGLASPRLAAQAATFRRLLAELPGM